MHKIPPASPPTAKPVVRVALALLPILLLAFTTLAVDPGDDYRGQWVLSETQDCPNGLVCTEWELRSGKKSGDPPCCQEANKVHTTSFSSCALEQSHFRH